MEKPVVLYVEDDETLRFITSENLEREGLSVMTAGDGLEAWRLFLADKPDICVLDVNLPKLDGFSLARRIRESDLNTPILFVTAKSLREDKLEGLLLGGDDYLIKPFSIDELVLKIRIFLRRSGVPIPSPVLEPIRLGNFELDKSNLILRYGTEEILLTFKESELLEFFIRHKGKLLTREQILETLWGGNDYFAGRSLDVYISKLRKYLSRDPAVKIENRHGIGFIFKA
ncbi:MAG TPA: DNA-binding response regulator [Bacteroidales bacterium]|nr:DNA-binding response regulator [Bacteroidales bacterium]